MHKPLRVSFLILGNQYSSCLPFSDPSWLAVCFKECIRRDGTPASWESTYQFWYELLYIIIYSTYIIIYNISVLIYERIVSCLDVTFMDLILLPKSYVHSKSCISVNVDFLKNRRNQVKVRSYWMKMISLNSMTDVF